MFWTAHYEYVLADWQTIVLQHPFLVPAPRQDALASDVCTGVPILRICALVHYRRRGNVALGIQMFGVECAWCKGPSESIRNQLRSPPTENAHRTGRSDPGAPSSRGTRTSGVSPAKFCGVYWNWFLSISINEEVVSTTSVRVDRCRGIASTPYEQSSSQIPVATQQHMFRDRQ